jgi:hypothetical protein
MLRGIRLIGGLCGAWEGGYAQCVIQIWCTARSALR